MANAHTAEIKKLTDALDVIRDTCATELKLIGTMAGLALQCMKSSGSGEDLARRQIQAALQQITERANELQNDIGIALEEAGVSA